MYTLVEECSQDFFLAFGHRVLISITWKLDAPDIPESCCSNFHYPLLAYFVAHLYWWFWNYCGWVCFNQPAENDFVWCAWIVWTKLFGTPKFHWNGLGFSLFWVRIYSKSSSLLFWGIHWLVMVTVRIVILFNITSPFRYALLFTLFECLSKSKGPLRVFIGAWAGDSNIFRDKRVYLIATILLLPEFDSLIYSLILFTVGMVDRWVFGGLICFTKVCKNRRTSLRFEGSVRISILQVVVNELERDIEDAKKPKWYLYCNWSIL